MKKQLLFAAVALVQLQAQAQQKLTPITAPHINQVMPLKNFSLKDIQTEKKKLQQSTANKGTANTSRWYNYVDLKSKIDPNISNNIKLTWLWHKYDMKSTFGTSVDTVYMRTYGTALDPSSVLFNVAGLYPGEMAIKSTDAYAVDSAIVYGIYDRVANSTTVDTLRISIVYGAGNNTNMPIYYFTGMQTQFQKDTVRFAMMYLDSVKRCALKNPNASNMPNVLIIDKYLTQANLADTLSNGMNYFKFAVTNFNVPANGIVGMTVSYKYGGTYTPFSMLFANNNFNYNAFSGIWYEENAGGSPAYTEGEYNYGFISPMPLPSTDGWYGSLIPMWAYPATLGLELPLIDLKLSCTTCNTTSVTDVESNIESVVAAPNPANDAFTISFNTLKNASSKVTITNLLGQEIDTKTIASTANTTSKAVFNVANLNAGVYIYTITSNEQTISNRFVVTH